MSQLPNDVSRCVSKTCAKRDICARFMDVYPGNAYSYSDFTVLCDNGHKMNNYFIRLEPKEAK